MPFNFMKTQNETDGGPAFPVSVGMGPLSANFASPGMSLRDWFAGMALQGIMAASQGSWIDIKEFATLSFRLADAMLKERQKL